MRTTNAEPQLRAATDLQSTAHAVAAEALIAAIELLRGDEYGPLDSSEAERFRSLARAVDADDSDISALRELRLTQGEFKRSIAPPPSDEEQMELAELVAALSGRHDGTYELVFQAAIDAGASREVAGAAAQAATIVPMGGGMNGR